MGIILFILLILLCILFILLCIVVSILLNSKSSTKSPTRQIKKNYNEYLSPDYIKEQYFIRNMRLLDKIKYMKMSKEEKQYAFQL